MGKGCFLRVRVPYSTAITPAPPLPHTHLGVVSTREVYRQLVCPVDELVMMDFRFVLRPSSLQNLPLCMLG